MQRARNKVCSSPTTSWVLSPEFFLVCASYFGTCLRNVRLARIFSLLLMKGKSFVAWLHKLASLCAMLRTHCYRSTKSAMHMLRAFVRCSAFLYVVAISNAEIEAVRLKQLKSAATLSTYQCFGGSRQQLSTAHFCRGGALASNMAAPMCGRTFWSIMK